jgi:hypothetical protein
MNSIKNNKKHPIDDLFQKKLIRLELTASEEAKSRFLDSLKSKKREIKPIWYFSAAASVLLISSISWFWFIPANNNVAKAKITSDETTISMSDDLSEKAVSSGNENAISIPLNQNKNEAYIPLKKKNTLSYIESISEINNPISSESNKSLTGVVEMDELILDNLTIALQASEKKRTQALQKESKIEVNKELFQKSVGETVVIVSSDLETNDGIYISGVNSDSPISLAEATDLGLAKMDEDRSLIAKVFTGLRHLKHGEKVSLNSLTASSETSILNNEDSFIGHETMEFRQRYNWLKGKLTKE